MPTFTVDATAKLQEGELIALDLRYQDRHVAMTAWRTSTLEEFALLALAQAFPPLPDTALQKRFEIEAHQEIDPETDEPYWVVDGVTEEPLPEDEAGSGFENLPGWATWTAAEAKAYIEANVTDLASAKAVLIKMAQAIVYLRDYVRVTG